ncbi:MAG TPA: (4Fe-4S)-binding protein [Firmicutes bacterium]|jgi:MinD superfamily P-loop ATPase|nr:(4Fe-4S)-binding protein [Bacillota bacterium]
MKIAVLSGKGGTGKTTVSASLAYSIENSQYIDCDVEEPNGAIFLKPELQKTYEVKVPVPEVDSSVCNGCGKCAKTCQFHALAVIKDKVLVFSEICHHCGACLIACPVGAIHETERTIGMIETNESGTFLHGRLNIGEPVGIPIIRELKKRMRDEGLVILDCPPGASCSVMKSVHGCDYCILVTEPTPFGLHDLKIAAELIQKMGIPYGVIINKATPTEKIIHPFCAENGIEVLLEIPFSREIAENYSKGILPAEATSDWKTKFGEVARKCAIQGREGG